MRLVSGMISLACSINFFPVLVLARLMNLLHLHSADFLTVFQFLQSVRRNINCMKQTMVLINNRSLHCFLLLQRIRTFTGSVTLLSSYSFNFLSSKSSPQWRRTLRGELVCLLTYTSCEDWDFVSPVASVSNFCSRQHLCFFFLHSSHMQFPRQAKTIGTISSFSSIAGKVITLFWPPVETLQNCNIKRLLTIWYRSTLLKSRSNLPAQHLAFVKVHCAQSSCLHDTSI